MSNLVSIHSQQARSARQANRARWVSYLAARTGSYDFRRRRYHAVAGELQMLGLNDANLIVDIGAGWCEFDYFLRCEINFRGRYVPIDGAICGTDLNKWRPQVEADFFVAIEVLEHLDDPFALLDELELLATEGIVITTPNSEAVDVLAMDPTHVTPLKLADFRQRGWAAEPVSLFGTPGDTIIAVFQAGKERDAA